MNYTKRLLFLFLFSLLEHSCDWKPVVNNWMQYSTEDNKTVEPNKQYLNVATETTKVEFTFILKCIQTISPKRKQSRFSAELGEPQTTLSQHAANARSKLCIEA